MKYKFSVLYPVHENVKKESIIKSLYSIINNSLKPNEILVMVDGYISQEKKLFLKKISKRFKNIKVIYNQKLGLSKILNKGLRVAKNEIIIRADSDDYNFKNRFKSQIDYFTKKNLDIMGCFLIENYDSKKFIRKTPKNPKILLSILINPINHMTVIFNKKSIMKINGYPDIEYKEDIALWIKSLIFGLKIENMEKNLVSTNVDQSRFSKRKNIASIFSEFKLFFFIIKLKPLILIFCFFSMILRLIYLLLPTTIFKYFQLNIFRK